MQILLEVQLEAEDSMFKGRPTAELAGDLIRIYCTLRCHEKKIFGAAKNGTLWQKDQESFYNLQLK